MRFAPAAACTPSRSAVLTGQPIWQIAEAGMLSGTLEDHGASRPLACAGPVAFQPGG